MKFFTPWENPPPITEEVFDPVSMVELVGYQTAEEKILAMMEAGIRLKETRGSQYLVEGDDENLDWENPLANRSLEMADLSEIQRSTTERIERKRAMKPVEEAGEENKEKKEENKEKKEEK